MLDLCHKGVSGFTKCKELDVFLFRESTSDSSVTDVCEREG